MDRTVDTDTLGVLSLNNTNTASGSLIPNAQASINKNTALGFATQVIVNGGDITPHTISSLQYYRLVGDGAATSLASLAFSANPPDLTTILLVGTDDTFTVEATSSDVSSGLYLNGNAVLKKGYILQLIYDATLQRYLEIGRNF